MNNKKGFTLVELLCVIVIMILLIVISYPNFSSLSGKAKTKYDSTTKVLIKSAASMYVNNHLDEFNVESKTITVGQLIDSGFLDSDLKDSKGKIVPRDATITVTRTVKNEVIEYNYICE